MPRATYARIVEAANTMYDSAVEKKTELLQEMLEDVTLNTFTWSTGGRLASVEAVLTNYVVRHFKFLEDFDPDAEISDEDFDTIVRELDTSKTSCAANQSNQPISNLLDLEDIQVTSKMLEIAQGTHW